MSKTYVPCKSSFDVTGKGTQGDLLFLPLESRYIDRRLRTTLDCDGAPSDLSAVPYGTCHFGISLPTGRTQSSSLLQKDWKEKRGETPFAILSGSVRQQHVLCPGLHPSEAVSVVTVRWVTIW